MIDNFPSLNKGATIFYTGTNENRLLRRKSLKKRTDLFPKYRNFLHVTPSNCGIPDFLCFFFESREIAFVCTTTPTHEKFPILP